MKISTLTNKIMRFPKVLVSLFVAAMIVVPTTAGFVTAADQVTLEGHTKALNVTAGETVYDDSTDLKVDEVAQVQLWQHNREAPGGTAAVNTTVKFSIPTEAGKTQIVTGTTSSDNGNTITDTTQINLSLDNAKLKYIPGTAKFRYNKGAVDGVQSCITGMEFPAESCYATVAISDEVIAAGVNLDELRGAPLNGCNAYHETVTIQIRSVADSISVNKYVRHLGEGVSDWATSTTAKPGDKLEYLIRFKNEGNTELKNVMVGDNLPKYNSYVADTTMIKNSNFPDGVSAENNNVTKGGINTGNYLPGGAGYVWFTAVLDDVTAYEKCGQYEVVNVGVVRPEGMNEFYNTASVKINVECVDQPVTPVYSCDMLKAVLISNKTYRFTTSTTATPTNRVQVKSYNYNFGDASAVMLTDKNIVEHTYAKAGTYKAFVEVKFTVDGSEKKVTSKNCEVTVSSDVKAAVTTLPNTGAGSTVAIIATAVAAIGAYAHRAFTLKRQ